MRMRMREACLRLLLIAITAIWVVTVVPVAQAQEADESKSEQALTVEVPVVTIDPAADTNDDSLIGSYIEQRVQETLSGTDVGVQSGARGDRLTDNDARGYRFLADAIVEIAEGIRPSTVIEIPISALTDKTRFTAAELGVEALLAYDDAEGKWYIPEDVYSAVVERVTFNWGKVFDALLFDFPYDLYWYDKTLRTPVSGMGLTTNSYEIWVSTDTITVSMPVATGYAKGTYEVDTSVGTRVKTALTNARGVLDASASMSNMDRLTYFKNRICGYTSYNNDATKAGYPYGDPWQLVYVFDGDIGTNVVCEGYAKAFKYLCDLADMSGVWCATVTGEMDGGGHMWNIVELDGLNYLVDVTNCDENKVGYPDTLFMTRNATGTVYEGFVVSIGWNSINYVYDEDTLEQYTEAELDILNDQQGGDLGELGAVVTLSATTYTYSGGAKKPGVTVTVGDATLSEGTDYEVAYANNKNAGTATVTVSGIGAYSGTISKSFTIKAKSLSTAEVVLAATSYTYSGKEKKPTATVTLGTKVLKAGTDYSLTYKDNVDAGEATAIVAGKGNYKGTASAEFTISPKSIKGATVTPAKASYAYTGRALTPSVTVELGSKPLVEGTDYTVSYKNNTEAGEATVTVKGKGNYKSTATGSFKIVPAKPALTKLTAGTTYVKAYWKAAAAGGTIDGWQVQRAVDSAFKTDTKSYKVKDPSATSKKLTGLTSGTTYYVRVRTWRVVDGVTYYSSWSTAKSITLA